MNTHFNNLLSKTKDTLNNTPNTLIVFILLMLASILPNLPWFITYCQAIATNDQLVVIPWAFVMSTAAEMTILIGLTTTLLTPHAKTVDHKLSAPPTTQVLIGIIVVLTISIHLMQEVLTFTVIEYLHNYLLLFVIFLVYKQRKYWRNVVETGAILTTIILHTTWSHIKNILIMVGITLGLVALAFWGLHRYSSYENYDHRFWEGLSVLNEFHADDSNPKDKQCAELYLKTSTKTTAVGKSGFMHKENHDPTGCLNVEEEGIRSTWQPQYPGQKKPFIIWVFGGSTTYSGYVADNSTIPSYLAQYLYAAGIQNIKVINFGLPAYNAIQSRVRFEQALVWYKQYTPNLVIFYEGVNEVVSALENLNSRHVNNYPSLNFFFNHYMDDIITQNRDANAVFNHLITLIFQDTWQTAVARFKFEHRLPQRVADHPMLPRKISTTIGEQAHEAYVANMKYIEDTARRLNIPVVFFLQPHAFTKNKWGKLEKKYIQPYLYMADSYATYYQLAKAEITTGKYSNWVDLSDIFRDNDHDLFSDWCHCRAGANKVIGEHIGEHILVNGLVKRQ